MRREKYVLTIWIAALTLWLAGCGSSSSSSTSNPVSGLKKRVLITNAQSGAVQLLDGQKDLFNKTIAASTPTLIVTSVTAGQTVVSNDGLASIAMIDNTKEAVTASGALVGPAFDVAITPDGKTAYAAVRNSGVVEILNTADGTLVTTVTVPTVTRLVMGPKGNKVLAFSDDPQHLPGPNTDSFSVIDTASKTVAPVLTLPAGAQPFSAVFDPSDPNDTTAFILFCGTECGGSAAPSVAKVNFATPATPTVNVVGGAAITGATVGLLNGSNLFVGGTTTSPAGCPFTACGSLQLINTGTLTAGTAIPITDGLHTRMALTSNNHLYVGASNCTPGVVVNNQVRGCLSIYNTGAPVVSGTNPFSPVESSFRSDLNVTGLQTISGRTVIYVIQGGELDIFDFTTDSLTPNQLDVVGHAVGVVQIDP
jgi:hypothetical protein